MRLDRSALQRFVTKRNGAMTGRNQVIIGPKKPKFVVGEVV